MALKKRVYIAYTGGTIGMNLSDKGFIPTYGFITEQMNRMPELKHPDMPDYTVFEYETLLDSSNMTPENWNRIAQDIANRYGDYDGFIILHGTDTMAYTASALSFMLGNLKKPVILTGSQLPLAEIRTDAYATLVTTLLLASRYPIPEVCIYFNNKLLRGNRARKMNTHDFNAFGSPNYPALATIGIDIKTREKLWLSPNNTPFKLELIKPTSLAYLRLFPGMSVNILEKILQLPLQGLVLETYGSGNAPNNPTQFLEILNHATTRDIVIMNCSQCIQGGVNMHSYATGNALYKAGVISGYDMTPETTLAKLYYLFSKGLDTPEIKKQMQACLRGELSEN